MLINFRTITSSLIINYESNETEINDQIKIINNQNQIIQKKYGLSKTLRINIIFKEKISISSLPILINKLVFLQSKCEENKIRWISICFTSNQFENINNISEIVRTIILKISNIFVHLIVDKKNAQTLDAYAKAIIEVSRLSESGFENFRLGISNGRTNNTPFFPYANFEVPLSFSVGLETLGLLIKHLQNKENLDISNILKPFFEDLAKELQILDSFLREKSLIKYLGIDASLAPIPRTDQSIGLLYELMGINTLGNIGSLSITSKLTNLLNKSFEISSSKKAGFNGVMFSPLEDDWLAKQSGSNILSIESLMLFSTVCGCGIDMVPLSGDIFSESLSALISDVITLSNKLVKPLGIRVLPIPGKFPNDKTAFNHEFLSDMKILKIQGSILPYIDF